MLYLRAELLQKSDTDGKPRVKADAGKPVEKDSTYRGAQKGGKYVARVQIGIEKDGSPMYRYFKSQEEYETYLKNQGKSKSAKDLEKKVKKEHEDSTKKHHEKAKHEPPTKAPGGLLSTTKKSLYIRG